MSILPKTRLGGPTCSIISVIKMASKEERKIDLERVTRCERYLAMFVFELNVTSDIRPQVVPSYVVSEFG